jgi:hypothetical protein
MESFIRELYYGNINPNAKCFDRKSQYGKTMELLSKNEELLNGILTGKEQQLFADYTKAWGDVLSISVCETFVDGFRLGGSLTLDTFIKDDNEFHGITEG